MRSNLFSNIKKARVNSGLSQEELAKKLGVTNKTISAYETGRAVPPATTITKIAEATKSSVADILEIEQNGDKHQEITKKLNEIQNKLNSSEKVDRVKVDTFTGVVLIDKKKRILLIKEDDKYRISKGRWNLPGGSVDGNETLIEAAEREVKEETGYKSKIVNMVGCYKCKKGENTWMYTVFHANLVSNHQDKIDPGVEETKWFTKEEFLKLDKSRIVHPDMKLVYKNAINNKGLPVESVKMIDYDKV